MTLLTWILVAFVISAVGVVVVAYFLHRASYFDYPKERKGEDPSPAEQFQDERLHRLPSDPNNGEDESDA